MSGRNWDRDRSRQLVRDRGVDKVADMGVHRIPPPARTKRAGYGSVAAAARWLITNRQRLRDEHRHAVPELIVEFGLSTKEACEAIRTAHEQERRP